MNEKVALVQDGRENKNPAPRAALQRVLREGGSRRRTVERPDGARRAPMDGFTARPATTAPLTQDGDRSTKPSRTNQPTVIHLKRYTYALLLAFASSMTHAQDTDSFSFDFDSSVFDDSNLFDAASSGPRKFTYKLSQQTYGHINKHSGTGIDGLAQTTHRGLEVNRLGLLVKYQNAFAPGWLLQGSAQAKIFWPGDYEYYANDRTEDTELRVNELFVQRSGERHSFSFGRQTVVWGETEGNSVLDVINTSEFRDLTIIDIEDARLNQWLLVWDYFGNRSSEGTGNSGSWSTFVNLYPEFNPPPVRGSPFFFEPPFNLTDYERDKPLFEVGTRWSRSFTGSDIAVMGAYLYENQLQYSPPANFRGDAEAVKNDYWLLGFSANRAIGKLLLKFDLAYNHDLLVNTLITPAVPALPPQLSRVQKSQIGTSFGFEYAISNEQNISVGLLAQRFLDQKDGLAAGEALLSDETTGNILLRYTNALMNNNLMLAATVQSALDGESLLVSLVANYNLNDNWAVMSQLIATRTDDTSPLQFLDQDVRLGATISFSF